MAPRPTSRSAHASSSAGATTRATPVPPAGEGWQGWDEYAPFYDWENAQTLGRRDIPFWRRFALEAVGPVLELGCGTGRISLPLARAGASVVGVDRSEPMLSRARVHRTRARLPGQLAFARADIRMLPFKPRRFHAVLAPYGVLQSLIRERDLAATLESVARVLTRGGRFGIDLVPDVPNWREYKDKVQMRGQLPDGTRVTLVESVSQDRQRRLTTFEQCYQARRNGRTTEHRFQLRFRSLSVAMMTRRLDKAGFEVEQVLGDYRGRPWDEGSDVWIILARKR